MARAALVLGRHPGTIIASWLCCICIFGTTLCLTPPHLFPAKGGRAPLSFNVARFTQKRMDEVMG